MSITGKIESPEKSLIEKNVWNEAFKYIQLFLCEEGGERERLLSMAPGDVTRTELSDGVFAMEQVYMSKKKSEGRFESHKKFIDIQAVIKGKEIAQSTNIERLTIDTPYSDESDLIFYKDGGEITDNLLSSGTFAIFYPSDAHKPGLMHDKSEIVYKIVVKIPIGKI